MSGPGGKLDCLSVMLLTMQSVEDRRIPALADSIQTSRSWSAAIEIHAH